MTRRTLTCVAAVLVLSVTPAGCDWAQAGYNGSNSGSQPFNWAFNPRSIGSLHAEWTATIPNQTPSQLAVAGDTVFASSQVPAQPLVLGSPLNYFGGGPIYNPNSTTTTTTPSTTTTLPIGPPPAPPFEALNAADGSVRWTAGGQVVTNTGDLGQCITTTSAKSPLVLDGVVHGMTTSSTCAHAPYTPFGSSSTLNASTGAVVATDPDHLVLGNPVGDRRAVYTTRTSNASGSSPSTFDVKGTDGFEFPAPQGRGLGNPAIDSRSLFVVDGFGRLYSVNRSTGAIQWSSADGAVGSGDTPSVGDGKVFVSTSTHLVAFDAAGKRGCTTSAGETTCVPVWDDPLFSPDGPQPATAAPPTISNHRLFIRQDWLLKVFSTDTGALLWQARTSLNSIGSASWLSAPPSVAGSIVFIGTVDGALQAYDVAGKRGCSQVSGLMTCTPLWSAALQGDASWARPVIAGNAVYMSSGWVWPSVPPSNAVGFGLGTSTVTKFVL